MNRKDFFLEMNKSFLDTIKAVAEPFVEEKLNQMDQLTDELLQIVWIDVTENLESLKDSQSTIISGRNIVFIRFNEEILAFEGICPTCKQILMYTWSKELKCYLCDQTVDLKIDEKQEKLKQFPLKQVDNTFLIGLY